MHPSVKKNLRIMEYETKIFNVIPYISSTSDKISNIALNVPVVTQGILTSLFLPRVGLKIVRYR